MIFDVVSHVSEQVQLGHHEPQVVASQNVEMSFDIVCTNAVYAMVNPLREVMWFFLGWGEVQSLLSIVHAQSEIAQKFLNGRHWWPFVGLVSLQIIWPCMWDIPALLHPNLARHKSVNNSAIIAYVQL